MRRGWNWEKDLSGPGVRFAEALGCVATHEYVSAVVALFQAAESGLPSRIVAERTKLGGDGEPLEDHREPGDWLTTGYTFYVGPGARDGTGEVQSFTMDRFDTNEGEQAAGDQAAALGFHADRGFCESMLQVKVILDRLGGQVFIQPYVRPDSEQIDAYAVAWEHLVRGRPEEPDVTLADLEEEDEEPESAPEAEEAEVEQEPQAA